MLLFFILFSLFVLLILARQFMSAPSVMLIFNMRSQCIDGYSFKNKSICVDKDIEIVSFASDVPGQLSVEIECRQLNSIFMINLKGKIRSITWLIGDRILAGGELCQLSGPFRIESKSNILSLSSKA